MPLNARFRPKKIYPCQFQDTLYRWQRRFTYGADSNFYNVLVRGERQDGGQLMGQGGREFRGCSVLLVPFFCARRRVVRVRGWTYSFAKTPLNAAQAPLATA